MCETKSYFEKNQQSKKILRICLQKEITTFLNYSLFLCAILWNEKKLPWMYEHFNNIYCLNEKDGYLWLDFAEEHCYPRDISEFLTFDSNI